MIDPESVDRAALAWHLVCEAFCNRIPQANVQKGARGTRAMTSGLPMATLNGVIATTREPDLGELIGFAESYSRTTLPWSIQVRGDDESPAIAALARRHGLTKSFLTPFMMKPLDTSDLGEPEHAASTVRRVPKEEHDRYRTVLARGFQIPEDMFSLMATPQLLGDPDMAGYFVEEDGIPVATSFGAITGDHVGLFNIVTLPAYRRRGHGRAATAAILRDAHARGVRMAFMHASPAGKPLYESMGFTTVEHWRVYSAPHA